MSTLYPPVPTRDEEDEATAYAAAVLRAAGVPRAQLATESMVATPRRMIKALRELCSGYHDDVVAILSTTFPTDGYRGIVAVPKIRFASMCEHHVLPFVGTVGVAYIPRERIVGLSKLPRIVRAFSRRLQVQERMTVEIAEAIEAVLKPDGVAVVARAEHTCKCLRGIESSGDMVTSEMRGRFREDATARDEVLRLLGEG